MKLSSQRRSELIAAALRARENAYAPYSKYAVGAALLTANGEIYIGVNVENSVYPESICAERSAVFGAVSRGERRFVAIAVATQNGGSPCGACRQVMSEFGLDIWVVMVNGKGEVVHETSVADLLPIAFGPNDLASGEE